LVKNIPTDFVVTGEEDRRLKVVVEKLLTDPAPGRSCLADRFAQALGP